MTTMTRNQQRIDAANAALDAYRRFKEIGGRPNSQSLDEWIIDLLADLRHLAAHHEVEFDRAIKLSELHFEEECSADA